MNVTKYNSKDCTITVNGVYITGLGENMVTGSKDEEFFSTSVGAQGDVIMNDTNNDLGTVTITVQATSPQKPLLLALAKAGSVVPLWVTNKSIGERMGGTYARIKNYPELANSAEAEDREFEFAVMDYTVDPI